MAVRIVDGNPGAGKTYWAVHHLLKIYFEHEPDLGQYFLKEEFKDVIIITNIDSLKLPHESLDELIAKCNQEEEVDPKMLDKYGKGYLFFSHDYQKKLAEQIQAPVVYVIDEAQRFFHKRYYFRPVFEWFELHRHFQQDIFLVTQKYRKLAPDILDLCEIIVHGVARTRSLTGKEFRYKHLSEGDVMKTEVVIKNQKVFALYKSMMGGKEVEKIDNPLIKKVAMILVAVVAIGIFGFYRLSNSFGSGSKVDQQAATQNATTIAGPISTQPNAAPNQAFGNMIPVRYSKIMGKVYIIFQGDLYEASTFPHKLERKGKSLYVRM